MVQKSFPIAEGQIKKFFYKVLRNGSPRIWVFNQTVRIVLGKVRKKTMQYKLHFMLVNCLF